MTDSALHGFFVLLSTCTHAPKNKNNTHHLNSSDSSRNHQMQSRNVDVLFTSGWWLFHYILVNHSSDMASFKSAMTPVIAIELSDDH